MHFTRTLSQAQPPRAALSCPRRGTHPGLLERLIGILVALRDRLAVGATVRALNSLDDRTLKDIGLHRSEIGSLVRSCASERRQVIDGCVPGISRH